MAGNRELVTCCEAINRSGGTISLMIILSGIQHYESFVADNNMPNNNIIVISEAGYSDNLLALKWLPPFDCPTERRTVGRFQLPLLHGFDSHWTLTFIDYCDKKNIIPFFFTPHSTHLLQPLNLVVFQPYKHCYSKALDEGARTGCTNFNKVEFLAEIYTAQTQTFKMNTILSAWRDVSIITFNPDIVLPRLPSKIHPPRTSIDRTGTRTRSRARSP